MIILISLSNEEIKIKARILSDSVGVYINEGPKKSEIYDEKGGKISIPLFRQVSSNFGMLALFFKNLDTSKIELELSEKNLLPQ